jgi:ribosomal protein L3 glutamine methyltransferase
VTLQEGSGKPMGDAQPLSQSGLDAVEELRDLRDLVRWCASSFTEHGLHFGHGTDDAITEAVTVVLHVLNLAPGLPDDLFASRLTRAERSKIVALAEERIRSRKPLPYLTAEAWFAGLSFYVDERVLVPRSPLAEWIAKGFEPFVDPDQVQRIADIGTGSGCIAIACALAFAESQVDAVDCSQEALEVAAHNVEQHGLEDRVSLVCSDLLAKCEGQYDLIISNPPYVPKSSYLALAPEYMHEPELGLTAGVDGLDVVRRLLAQSASHLSPHGVLVVEVGEAAQAFEHAFPQLPVTWLEFENGGDGVFVLTRDGLQNL